MFFWDLGTSKVRVSASHHSTIVEESPLVAFDVSNSAKVIAFGTQVEEMEALPNAAYAVERCVDEGFVADESALFEFVLAMRRSIGSTFRDELLGSRALIAVPVTLGPAQYVTLKRVFENAGFLPLLVPAPYCILDSQNHNPMQSTAHCIIDIGRGKTNFSVLSHGQIVAFGRSSMTAGAIEYWLRLMIAQKFDTQVSAQEVSRILKHEGPTLLLRGKQHKTGAPTSIKIESEVFAGMLQTLYNLLSIDVLNFLQKIPTTYSATLSRNDLLLCGGGALLPGLSEQIAKTTAMNVRSIPRPARALIMGLADFLTNPENARFLLRSSEMLPLLNVQDVE